MASSLPCGHSPQFLGRNYCPISSLDLCHHFGEDDNNILNTRQSNSKDDYRFKTKLVKLDPQNNGQWVDAGPAFQVTAFVRKGATTQEYLDAFVAGLWEDAKKQVHFDIRLISKQKSFDFIE